jgi:hypothetical protein
MFIKLTRTADRTYAQLVESFRDELGKPRQRTIATIGRVDENGGQVDALLAALLRAKGRGPMEPPGAFRVGAGAGRRLGAGSTLARTRL